MDKVTKFLEKHVQWVALGLGALFLIWMIYGNIIQRPVSVPVGTEPAATPGEVDVIIADGPAKKLDAEMQNTTVPKIEVKDFNTALTQNLGAAPSTYALLTVPWTSIPTQSTGPIVVPVIEAPKAAQVTELPHVPAPTDLQVSQGRSNVMVPNPPTAVGPGVAPVGPVANGQGTPMDKNWVSVGGMIPIQKLATEFADKKIPSGLNVTTMLRVQLVRQEQDTGGNWGPEKVVDPLLNVSLMELPGANSGLNQQNNYVQWAEKDQLDLLRPTFYQVLQADPWRSPWTPAPEQVVVEEAFDPSKVGNDLSKLTPDQMKQYQDYRAAKDKEAKDKAAARRGSSRTGGGPGPGGYPGGEPGGLSSGGYGGGGSTAARRTPPPATAASANSSRFGTARLSAATRRYAGKSWLSDAWDAGNVWPTRWRR